MRRAYRAPAWFTMSAAFASDVVLRPQHGGQPSSWSNMVRAEQISVGTSSTCPKNTGDRSMSRPEGEEVPALRTVTIAGGCSR
jgi:hypothetical protein